MYKEAARVEGRVSFVEAWNDNVCFGLEMIDSEVLCSLRRGLRLPRKGQIVRVTGFYSTAIKQAIFVDEIDVLAEPPE